MDSLPAPPVDLALTERDIVAPAQSTQAAPPDGPWIENPPWSGLDLLLLACVVFFGIVFFSAVAVGILHGLWAQPLAEIAGNPSVWIVIPAEGAAYLVMFAVLYWLAGSRHLNWWSALSWRWPQGLSWIGFLLVGFALAFVAGLLQKILPMPKELPIEKLFLQPGAPQLLALFGVSVAPFVEETFFRGLLYPISNRWLRNVLNSQQSLWHGGFVFLALLPWGFASVWHPPWVGSLLAVAALILTALFCVLRVDQGRPADAVSVIMAGVSFSVWALVASHATRHFVEKASFGLLLVGAAMMILGWKLQPGSVPTRIGIALSLMITALSFTLLHGEQLGESWAPLVVLLVVSSVLTLARALTKSLATSVLIHVGYNSTLFGSMYFATDHFRHLEQLTR